MGPAYLDVAMRYRDDKQALTRLQQKLKTGGAGVWGEIPMPPQAAVNEQESQKIIQASEQPWQEALLRTRLLVNNATIGARQAQGILSAALALPPRPASRH